MGSAEYFDENGVLVLEITVDDSAPLDPVGALATLLVVEGVTDLTSAASVVRLPEQALIDEALAWSLG